MQDVDRSVTTHPEHHPEPTDIYDFLMGEGFVMRAEGVVTAREGITSRTREISASEAVTGAKQPDWKSPPEVWLGIEDDVRTLEGLLR